MAHPILFSAALSEENKSGLVLSTEQRQRIAGYLQEYGA